MSHYMLKPAVLSIEDNKDEREIIRSAIGAYCLLTEAETLHKAEEILKKQIFSLIILDGSLPDGDGFKFCQRLREDHGSYIPIIILSSRGGVDERVSGFAMGADDYIVKPFEPVEFAARVQAKLKLNSIITLQKSFTKGQFHVDVMAQRIYLTKEDDSKEQLNLTPIESKLMIHFLQHEGQILSRQDLMKTIWGESTHISSHTIDTHISSLRKKIGGEAKNLRAVLRKGYCYSE